MKGHQDLSDRIARFGPVTPAETTLRRLEIRHHTAVGCSTGFVQQDPDDWTKLVERMAEISTAAVELSALSEPELPALVSFLLRHATQPFDFVSVHAPSKDRTMADRQMVGELKKIRDQVQAFVFHPDSMRDLDAYAALGPKLVIENMDVRKRLGQTAEQLRPYLRALPEARFCLDVAHVKSVDASMQVGVELLNEFRNRLSHLHVSSLDDEQHHVPLSEEDEELFAPLLDRCRDVPWILEAPPRI